MHLHRESSRHPAGAFTLLEIMIAMFVLSLLLAGIFAIVGGTTEMASEIEQVHKREAEIHGFAQFCERILRGLPGMAEVRLRVTGSGRQYLSELAMKNAPSPIGGGAAGMTILRTEQAPDGYLRVVLESLSDEETAALELGKGGTVNTRLALLENVSRFEWKFFNPRSSEWETVWNDKLSLASGADGQPVQSGASRPGLVELNIAIGADAPRRFVFWVPPGQVPPLKPVAKLEANPVPPVAVPPPSKSPKG